MITPLDRVPTPPDWDRHLQDLDIARVWEWISPKALFSMHLGFRGNFEEALLRKDPKAVHLKERVATIQQEILSQPDLMRPKAVWQFFKCRSEKDRVFLFEKDAIQLLTEFLFPRQLDREQLCIADYFNKTKMDVIGMFVVTAGAGVSTLSRQWQEQRRFSDLYILHSLALQTVEAAAELLHAQLRQSLGILDSPTLSRNDILDGAYTGKRFSFGYSACPNLSDQCKLFDLLQPAQIGVSLSHLYMMAPEAAVSALVIHHPQASYFSVL